MRTIKAAIVGVSVLAMLSLMPCELAAKAHGFHGAHFGFHWHGGHHHHAYGAYGYGAYGAWPYYGDSGILPYAPDSAVSSALPVQIIYVPEPPQALSCHRSEQTVTVPAESGGTRQITVQRC